MASVKCKHCDQNENTREIWHGIVWQKATSDLKFVTFPPAHITLCRCHSESGQCMWKCTLSTLSVCITALVSFSRYAQWHHLLCSPSLSFFAFAWLTIRGQWMSEALKTSPNTKSRHNTDKIGHRSRVRGSVKSERKRENKFTRKSERESGFPHTLTSGHF